MRTAILSVGTEILFGQITNTNTVYLSQQLNLLGFDVMYHYTVGDNSGRLSEMIEMAFRDCDLVITTGGLGPTEDDLTKETACRVLHDELVLHEPSMERLVARAKAYGKPMTPNNYKQAMMPSRAEVFSNEVGSAPGLALCEDEKMIICMPGPPREMTWMWENRVRPYLEKLQTGVIYYRTLRMFGIGESLLETKLLDLIDAQTDPTLATYAKEGECSVRIASKRATCEEAVKAVENMIAQVSEKVGEYIYSVDDEELADVVAKKLLERNISVSACESCTGGLFSGALTDTPGISKVFDRGLVTYTYGAKMDELGVKEETLAAYTAESSQVAKEMAEGLAKKTGSRLCISVTGIAGPGGGTPEKPVGLIYIGCVFDGHTEVKEVRMRNVSRKWNRHYAVLSMFDMINKTIDQTWN
ncbi:MULTISPECIES: competence/damage-inducible protein A [Clostridia]|uniref:competence/damage-inducible protein A n=1 Tax=Anaerovoracaceae TaxID=543314 RepID=UPI001379F41D|nr:MULTISPECIES: competence/damage-inducible protein A [Clostridia]MCI9639546.1 competence/damage-inducible protein A [Emergencia sp.]NCE98892.1 competence/damage-inducible protein A [Emergencia sp. 1XD21-10]